jgi:amino-acid N-acetyltransferase
MEIRQAKITDAKAINSLINFYAEQDRMLFRSLADIYENLRSFCVAEQDGEITGCCALQIVWSDLAEIKSLAVAEKLVGTGVGSQMVKFHLRQAKEIGINKVFALTLNPEFFKKLGFDVVDKDTLPMKVWSDCARCRKQENCDETAVLLNSNEKLQA